MALLASIVLALFCYEAAADGESILTGASTSDHLWVVLARPATETDGTARHLYHLGAHISSTGWERDRASASADVASGPGGRVGGSGLAGVSVRGAGARRAVGDLYARGGVPARTG